METVVRRPPVIIRKKAAPPPPTPEPEKKKGGTPCKVDLTVKLDELPDLKTDGKKFARITVRSEPYGYMELFVNPKTYRKCQQTIKDAPPGTAHVIMIDVPFIKAEKHGGKVVARGCGIQVFEKKKKKPKHENQSLN